ncbi:MAG: flagellar biosynthesis protein FlhF [Nitrospiraceae bacterium]
MKTFRARTMQDAIRSIKSELGPDAVILSTKHVQDGKPALGVFGRPLVEVTAAIDAEADRLQRSAAPRSFGASTSHKTTHGEDGHAVDRFGHELRASLDRHQHESEAGWRGARESPDRPAAGTGSDFTQVMEELKQLRRLLKDARETRPVTEQTEIRDIDRLAGLRSSGLGPETLAQIVGELRQADAEALNASSMMRQAVNCLLAGATKVAGPLLSQGHIKKTVVFVGPTGVGKTTTIAKLAAYYRLREGKSVALITLDTYRLAAVEQLRMYANLIGVKLDVALTKADAIASIKRRSHADLILIDTAGRSPRDTDGLHELKQLISMDHPVEVQLVLSATTREQDIVDGLGGYADLAVSQLLFTKLDEATQFGGIFEAMQRLGRPLSYFSLGQRVPEDLEVARPDRLADLILGGTVGPARCRKPFLTESADGEWGTRPSLRAAAGHEE